MRGLNTASHDVVSAQLSHCFCLQRTENEFSDNNLEVWRGIHCSGKCVILCKNSTVSFMLMATDAGRHVGDSRPLAT
jgi:hypothetical protein